jgi:hypothetical protein
MNEKIYEFDAIILNVPNISPFLHFQEQFIR